MNTSSLRTHIAHLMRMSVGGRRPRPPRRRQQLALGLDRLEGRLCLAAGGFHTAAATTHQVAIAPVHATVRNAASAIPVGTITGTVTVRHAYAMPHVAVKLYDPAGNLLSTAVTDLRGRYTFRGLAAGNYLVEEMPPRRFTQLNPTFPNYAPTKQATPSGGFGNAPGDWNYTGSGGATPPSDWVTSGTRAPFESAINITGQTVNLSKYLSIHYVATKQYTQKVTSSNAGSPGYQLQATGFAVENTMRVNRTDFELKNIHFHEATENIVNGSPPGVMEVHFVNESAAGGEAVLALFIKVGRNNPTLGRFFGGLSTLSTAGGSTQSGNDIGLISFRDLLPKKLDGWFYSGSLTTPPLSTPVSFFVLATPIEMSLSQFQQYQSFATSAGFFPNNRPIQPLDGRIMNSLTAVTLGNTAGSAADIVNIRT